MKKWNNKVAGPKWNDNLAAMARLWVKSQIFLLLIFGSIKLQKKIGSITLQWLQIYGSNHMDAGGPPWTEKNEECRRGDSCSSQPNNASALASCHT